MIKLYQGAGICRISGSGKGFDPGKLTGMVLLSDAMLAIEPAKIRDVKGLKTWIGGKLIYEG